MKYICSFLFSFIIVYLFYYLLIILRKEKLKMFNNNSYYKFLIKRYKLDTKKINNKMMANIVALANSFILAFTSSIVMIVENIYLELLLALAILILLQLFVYHIIGILLKRREKNV